MRDDQTQPAPPRPWQSALSDTLQSLARQRRRTLILAVGLVLAAALRLGATPLAYLAVLPALVIAALVLGRAPRYRQALESLALGAVVAAAAPVADLGLPILVPAGACMGYLVLYGRWWDWTPLRIGVTSSRRARLPVPIETLWAALVPGEGRAEEYWTGTLIDYDVDPDDPMTRYLRHDRPTDLPGESTVTFVEWCHQSSCRYIVEEAHDGPTGDAEVTLSFDPVGEADTIVESVFVQSGLSPRLALHRWLDGRVGDEWDIYPARVTRSRQWSVEGPPSSDASAEPG